MLGIFLSIEMQRFIKYGFCFGGVDSGEEEIGNSECFYCIFDFIDFVIVLCISYCYYIILLIREL